MGYTDTKSISCERKISVFFLLFVSSFLLASCFFLLAPSHAHAMTLGNSGPVAGTSLTQGLIGWWTFDGRDMLNGVVQDRGTAANKGNLENIASSTFYIPGKLGQAFRFNGANQDVNMGNSADQILTSNWSISAWVKTTMNPAVSAIFVSKRDSSATTNAGYQMFIANGGTLAWAIGDGSAGGRVKVISTGPTINDNKWHLVSVTYNRSGSGIGYVDGVPATAGSGSITSQANSISTAYNLYIGRESAATPLYFNGSIDDVRIYNRVLAPTELKQLYLAGQATLEPTSGQGSGCKLGSLSCGLVSYWSFNNQDMNWTSATAGTVKDMSGNGNTGTLTNMNRSSSPIPGALGQALKFNGSSSYVSGANIVNVTKATVSAWVKISSYPAAKGFIAGFMGGLGGTNYDKDLYIDTSGKLFFYVWDGAAKTTSAPANGIPLNQWVHVVGTADGSNARTYVNGVQVGSAAAGNTFAAYLAADIFAQGAPAGPSTGGGYMQSQIDDVRIYNRALSGSEVEQLYMAGQVSLEPTSGQGNGCALGSLSCGLVGYWTFNNQDMNWTSATAGTVKDMSGNGNTGTLTNMNRTTSPVAGKLGQALKFNGTSSHINTSSTAFAFDFTNPFSISLWYQTQKVTGVANSFLGNFNGASRGYGFGPKGMGLCSSNDKMGFLFWTANNTGITVCTPANTIVAGTAWHHAVMTYNGNSHASGVHIYVDGVDQALSTVFDNASGSAVSNGILELGDDQTNDPFSGSMDDFRVYNRALSAAEVRQLYMGGL